jgi:hypothetical protein
MRASANSRSPGLLYTGGVSGGALSLQFGRRSDLLVSLDFRDFDDTEHPGYIDNRVCPLTSWFVGMA